MKRFVHLCVEAEIEEAGEAAVFAKIIRPTYLVDKSQVEWVEGDEEFKKCVR